MFVLEGGDDVDDEGVVELGDWRVTSIRRLRSAKMYLSLFCWAISFFLTTFIAYTFAVAHSRTRKTLPKQPLPITQSSS